jgi:ribosomal protein S18 acetylase RimI-like enzyme
MLHAGFVRRPRREGRGIGTALIHAVYSHADEKQAAQTSWLTATSNKAAQKLYGRVANMTPFVKYRR